MFSNFLRFSYISSWTFIQCQKSFLYKIKKNFFIYFRIQLINIKYSNCIKEKIKTDWLKYHHRNRNKLFTGK